MATCTLSDESLLSGLFGEQVAQELAAEDAARAAAEEAARDHIGERLIADGFFHNDYALENDGSFGGWGSNEDYPHPWNLPSRLFIFPAQTLRGPDGVRRIGVRHPLLMNHPLVQQVIAKGYEVCSPDDCENEHGVSMAFMDHGEWWHAVDLIKTHHVELLNTRHFTTDEDITAAVRYRLEYPGKTPLSVAVSDMRSVMATIGISEPEDGSESLLNTFDEPHATQSEGKKKPYWPINTRTALKSKISANTAWAFIHGIEQGWFQNDNGYLHWSAKGIAAWKAVHRRPVATTTHECQDTAMANA